ncbi:MAG TPA: signal peptide peptidase SppA [candidate division Zixibacteria bacterium]|nr:signal peptide peptidase SppA [candidate division Zixibacteria bacterium]
MNNKNKSNLFIRSIRKPGQLLRGIRFGVSRARVSYGNWMRRIRRLKLDYVVMQIGGSLPERAGPPRGFIQRRLPFPPRPLSMEIVHKRFQMLADADNVKGLIIILGGLSTGTATLESLRMAIERLKSAGKTVVVYSPMLDLGHYFVAVAADRIVVPPSSTFEVLGVHADSVFLKDALGSLGIQAEVVQISPYKTGFDNLGKSEMSDEYREQIEWILDDTYEQLVSAIALGRNKTIAEVKELIDGAPYTAAEAFEHGLVDNVTYEDSLAYLLHDEVSTGSSEESSSKTSEKDESAVKDKKKAKLATWSRARRIMLAKYRRPLKKYIGVLTVEGMITPGPSRKPPINLPIPFMGSETAGDETVIQMLRLAERDSQMAALVLHIDSPGGVHLAADLMWRQVARLAKSKPVVCYFGNVAASGGYYVGAPATHIVAPGMTLTGSVGVYSAHISTGELYNRLGINRVLIGRGERALLRSDASPLDDDRRKILWDGIMNAYIQFKQVVADGRNLELDELDEICEGRIWTGRQALKHKLIDSQGDFIDALSKAAELANLPMDDDHRIEDINIYSQSHSYLLPRPFEQVDDLMATLDISQTLELYRHPLAMMPLDIRIW